MDAALLTPPRRLTIPVDPIEAAGLNGDMLEAQAFAHLARTLLEIRGDLV